MIEWPEPIRWPPGKGPTNVKGHAASGGIAPAYNHWLPLHRYPFEHYKDAESAKHWYYSEWLPKVPSIGCSCQSHWKDLTEKHPPDFSSPEAMFEWGWARHDDVSREHSNRPRITLEEAYIQHCRIYRDVSRDRSQLNPRNDRLIITVATGSECEKISAISSPQMRRYAEQCNADFVCLTGVTQGWWGLEKFRIRPFAEQYKQTLFLDADIWIKDDSPNIFDTSEDIAVHDDMPHNSCDWVANEYTAVHQSQGNSVKWPARWLLNSGVVLTSNKAASVWTPPSRPLPGKHCDEQFWVEHQIEQSGLPVHRLDIRFNTQYWMTDFRQRLKAAWFVHYANAPDKLKALETTENSTKRGVRYLPDRRKP
jgi:hypothetical protein